MLNIKVNALIIHGGGLVDCSSQVLMRFAKDLKSIYQKVYIGQFSFESLYKKDFWFEYDHNLVDFVKDKKGTFFGTCRDIYIEGYKYAKAIQLLKENNITTIIVCGGDGSSRQVAEMSASFKREGIQVIFPIPLTIDGINGGESICIKQAVRESVRQIENMAATSLQTRDAERFGVLIAELPGRNRDDITAEVIKYFDIEGKIADFMLEDILFLAIPATIETDLDQFLEIVNLSVKKTLILLSEGSEIKMPKLKEKITRKVRTVVVGHQAQTNNQTTEEDVEEINRWVDETCFLMRMSGIEESFCISKDDFGMLEIQDIDYYAKLNPKGKQECFLSAEKEKLLKEYMIAT